MNKELVKIKNNCSIWNFEEIFEGVNGNKKVWCCLDNNCVRYTVTVNGKLISRREFSNDKKELCFKNATKALNK